MTTLIATVPRPAGLFAGPAALAAALLALALLWGGVETRLIDGVPVWEKPAKFALALLLTFGTLALVEGRLSDPWAQGRLLRGTAVAMGAAMAFEMGYMILQAARGEGSHFNQSTPYHATMYALMGLGAVILTVGIGVVGWAALRDPAARLSPGLRLAVGWSFLAAVPLVLVVAGRLGGNGSHFIGTPAPGAPTVPLLGWSLAVGDLRPAHFLALHVMQAVPLWVLAREALGARVGGGEVATATLLWSALTLALFAQALMGLPLVRL